jgi:uncharacterized delta-60 repeat protein
MRLERPERKNSMSAAGTKRGKAARHRQRAKYRPACEQLEDRCLMAAGVLDAAFDFDGMVTSDFTGAGFSKAVALDPNDGTLVVAGAVFNPGSGHNQLSVARYSADGTLLASFGTGGLGTVDFPGSTSSLADTVTIQADGKIVAAGFWSQAGGPSRIIAMARFNTDGSLDTSFGVGGIVSTNLPGSREYIRQVAVQADGKILAAAFGSDDPAAVDNQSQAVLLRYNADGSLDTTFDTDGYAVIRFAGWRQSDADDLVVQADGKIVLSGYVADVGRIDAAMMRVNADGSLDTTFGVGGLVVTDLGSNVDENLSKALVQADGKIVAVGFAEFATRDAILVRYNADGSLDSTFGTNGQVILDHSGATDSGYDLALQADGKIVMVGFSVVAGNQDFFVSRFDANGVLDTTFGTGGVTTTDFAGGSDTGWDVVIQNGDKIVVAGSATISGTQRVALARYIANEAPTADPGGPYTIQEGESLTLDGSLSTDPDNDALTYSWDVNGDGTFGDATGVNPTLTWDQLKALGIDDGLATRNVTVRIDDGQGHTDDSSSVVLTVTDKEPTLTITGPSSAGEGIYTLNLASSDPGDDTIDHWTINWGDGTTAQVVIGSPSSVTHVYDGTANRTITATATDEDGTFAANSVFVRINNVAPTLTLTGNAATDEGAVYTLNLDAVDPGLDTIQRWTINWGDGSKAQTVVGNPSSVTHVFADGLKNVTISATAASEDGTFASNTLAVTVNNVVRVATIGGPASIAEGSVFGLNLSSVDPGADKVGKWVINWGDGKIQTVTGNPALVNHAYIADGTRSYTISATAFDEDGSYASNTLDVTVQNVAPTAKIVGPKQGLAAQLLTFTLSATDPSAVDRAAGFTYTIDWGDGSAPQVTAVGSGTSFKVQHAFTTMGIFPVQVTAADKDGGASVVPASWLVAIPTDGLHPDPVNPSQTALFITGTTGNDKIAIAQNGTSLTSVIVTVNGVRQGVFSPTGRIIVYGDAGNDAISVAAGVQIPTALYGDEGNDVLTGGGGNDILVGGNGNDSLRGGLARDLLLGGLGADALFGDIPGQYARAADGGNLLIGNPTVYDDDLESLAAILAKWTSAADFTTRTNDLTSGNGVPPLTAAQMTLDSALDKLYGGGGQDWFWALGDTVLKNTAQDRID